MKMKNKIRLVRIAEKRSETRKTRFQNSE